MNLTVLKSFKPQPAFIVSLMCELIESSLFISGRTATIPPWASLEPEISRVDLVTTSIPSFVCFCDAILRAV